MDTRRLIDSFILHFPERKNIQIVNLRNITSGWETEILSFDLMWNFDDGSFSNSLVARIFLGKWSVQKAEKEFQVMKHVKGLSYPVPTIHFIETDSNSIGKPFIVMDRIDGCTLDERTHLSDRAHEEWTEIFCKLFFNLHKLDWRGLVDEEQRRRYGDSFYITRSKLTVYRNGIEKSGNLDFIPLVEWLEERIEPVPCITPSITHGDFHSFNILVDRNDQPFVIDWGGSAVSDSRYDIAWTLLLYSTFGSIALRDDLLHRYQRISGKSVEQIEYFEVFACLRRLIDVFISVTQGGDENGLRPEVVDLMRSSIHHIINVRDRLKALTGISIPTMNTIIEELSQ